LLGGIQFAAHVSDKLEDGACSAIAATSAASFKPNALAGESIAALFGTALSETTLSATATPLPTSLAGVSVKVKDGTGAEQLAPLFFVSPSQINFLVPANLSRGTALMTILKADGTAPGGAMQVNQLAPALFTANANGQGVAAGVILRIGPDGSRTFEPTAKFDDTQNRFVPLPINVSRSDNEVFLVLFGTGFRNASAPLAATVKIGGFVLPVMYAGSQGTFAGLDQINLRLTPELAGRGETAVELQIDGQSANAVLIAIQ
jgi:uncharacterized protein (TIGR03437 family)